MLYLAERFRKCRKGQSLVEFALILPLVLIILFGIIEFGRVFHSYLVITHAAREGARNGVISKDVTEIKQEVQEAASGIELDLDNDIEVNPSVDISTGEPLTVKINHEVQLFSPLPESIMPGEVPLTATSTMRVE